MFAVLSKAARSALERAEESEEGRVWSAVHCLICSAFSLEAYLNHAGERRYECWKEIERKLPIKAKIALLLEGHGGPDWGSSPFQCVNELISVRNEFAHGRTQELRTGDKNGLLDLPMSMPMPAPGWEHLANDIARVRKLFEESQSFMAMTNKTVFGERLPIELLWSGGT